MRQYALIFLACFAPRSLYLVWAPPPTDLASNYYWDLSESLLRSGVLGLGGQASTAFEPLYPLFLAVGRWLTGDSFVLLMLLQIAIASIGAVYFFRLCLLLAADERVAQIAVLIYSFYPYLVRQSVSAIEITLLTTLLIATAYHFCRATDLRGSLWCGLAFGLTLLARAAALPVLALALAVLICTRRYAHALAVAATALVLVLPFVLRNHQLDGSLMPSRSGVNLFAGNNEYADKLIPHYNLDLLDEYAERRLQREAPQLAGRSDREIDGFYNRKALEFMQQEPLRTLRLKLLNIGYFFHPRLVPFNSVDDNTILTLNADGGIKVDGVPARSAAAEWVHALSYSVILVTALACMRLRRTQARRDSILYCMLLGFVIVCSVYFPATRLRAPVDFVLMFFSACALARWTRAA